MRDNESFNKTKKYLQSPTKKQQCVKFFRLPSLMLDNVSVNATIPSSGYAPGQVIPLHIDINNKSSKHILEFKVELNKVSVQTIGTLIEK